MKIYAKENLKEIVMRKGYSVTDLAKETGITKQGLGLFLNRKMGLVPKNAHILCNTLGEEFDNIFTFVERKSSK